MERKCPKCLKWNSNEAYCSFCNEPLAPRQIRKRQIELVEKKQLEIPKPKLDAWFLKFKNNKNPIVKVLYYLCYSIWTVYMAIVSFILFMVAWGPG